MRLLPLAGASAAFAFLLAESATGNYCKPRDPASEQRVCPNSDIGGGTRPKADCKDCATECSVMGDPHASPFYSKCTQVVGMSEGSYLLYYVPKNGSMKRDTNFTMGVYKHGGKHWIKQIILNDEVVLDADVCWTGAEEFKNGTIPLWSDEAAAIKGSSSDVELYYEVFCRDQSQSKGSKQLIVNIRLHDGFDTHEPAVESSMPPSTTFFFKSDKGICTDPVKYGMNKDPSQIKSSDYDLVCSRQSPFKHTSGRYCKCSASCASWGDPHVMDYYTRQCRSSSKCNFKSPITPEPQYNILYHTGQVFGVRKGLDDRCHLQVEAEIYALKSNRQNALQACSREAGKAALGDASYVESFSDSDWDVLRLRAEDVCSEQNQAWTLPGPETNTGIPAMDAFNRAHYSARVQGKDLGTQILVQQEGRQYLVPVSGSNHATCLRNKGFDPSQASSRVDAGGVTTTVTCRVTQGGLWYFNFCVNKRGMQVQKFYQNSQELQNIGQMPKVQPRWSEGMIQSLEQAAFTGGFCATGNFQRGSGTTTAVQNAAFTFRAAGETRAFVRAGTNIAA